MDNSYKQNRKVLTSEIANANYQVTCVQGQGWAKSRQGFEVCPFPGKVPYKVWPLIPRPDSAF